MHKNKKKLFVGLNILFLTALLAHIAMLLCYKNENHCCCESEAREK